MNLVWDSTVNIVTFGYYDKSPLSDCQYLLSHRALVINREFTGRDFTEIGYFDLRKGQKHKFCSIGKTNATNWQQGSMLQWQRYSGKLCVCFNVIENRKVIGRVLSMVKCFLMSLEGLEHLTRMD